MDSKPTNMHAGRHTCTHLRILDREEFERRVTIFVMMINKTFLGT